MISRKKSPHQPHWRTTCITNQALNHIGCPNGNTRCSHMIDMGSPLASSIMLNSMTGNTTGRLQGALALTRVQQNRASSDPENKNILTTRGNNKRAAAASLEPSIDTWVQDVVVPAYRVCLRN